MAAASAPTFTEFSNLLAEHIRAGYQMMYVPTAEEHRVEEEIQAVAERLKMKFITWDIFEGFSLKALNDPKLRNPQLALATLGSAELDVKKAIFVFRDLNNHWNDPAIRRAVRSLYADNRLVNTNHRRPLIITNPRLEIHFDLKTCMAVLDFDLPGEVELSNSFDYVQGSLDVTAEADGGNKADSACTPELKEQLVGALLGLTSIEAENCLSRCITRHLNFRPEMLATIKEEKATIIKKSEVLTYVAENPSGPKALGGFENWIEYTTTLKGAYTKRARELQLDYPKGVILAGPQGTGKSTAAELTANIFGIPLVKLDTGALFGSHVGETEGNVRAMIKQVTAIRRCVLLIDEADKAWGNAHEAKGDSGVTMRAFGQILSWLAEKQDGIFVIATANRPELLPPEFRRAGRFDTTFFTDLPSAAEREAIIKIHLQQRSVDLTKLNFTPADWNHLTTQTDNYVGAELEQVVKDARLLAFEKRNSGDPTLEEFLLAQAARGSGSTDMDLVNSIRKFCKEHRARPVRRDAPAQPTKRSRHIDTSSNN